MHISRSLFLNYIAIAKSSFILFDNMIFDSG